MKKKVIGNREDLVNKKQEKQIKEKSLGFFASMSTEELGAWMKGNSPDDILDQVIVAVWALIKKESK